MPTVGCFGVQATIEPAYTASRKYGGSVAMIQIFLQSVRRYGRWYAEALLPGRHPGAGLTGRRLVFLLVMPLFFLVQLLHWVFLALDEIVFPGYRHTPVTAPVFITGIPRSGTTYLHRALAANEGFSVFTTWEVLLAPSVVQRRCVHALARLDSLLGAPCQRLLSALFRRLGKDLDEIHPVALNAPEEDYLLLLPAASCFFLLLAFPYDSGLRQLPLPARLPSAERERLLDFYHRLLQRHLHDKPANMVLLSKNAAFAGWPPYLLERYPDARIVVCARCPDAALASQLRALVPARAIFGTDSGGEATEALFTALYRDFYRSVAAFLRGAPADSVRVVIQEDMRADSASVLAALQAFIEPASGMGGAAVVSTPENDCSRPPEGPPAVADDPTVTARAAFEQILASPLRVGVAV